MKSIRKSLLLWLLTGVLVAGLGAGIATFIKTQEEVGEMFDYELRQIAYSMEFSARSMASQMENMNDPSREDNDFMVQVWDARGTLLYSSRPATTLPAATTEGFSTIDYTNSQWRVFRLVSGNRVIQAAQPAEARWEETADMALRTLAPLAVLVPALALLVLLAVKKSLYPLARVTAEVERRDASAMTPLDASEVPEEIRPLLAALNNLLHRLDESIASQRRFVADAAHELRTPLTALSLQADLVAQAQDSSEQDDAIKDLRLGIARASHLVNQLLILARQEPEAQRPFTRLDLAALVRQVVGEFIPLAEFKGIDLGVDANQPISINGDEDSLRVLLGNLVDNAIRYTPKGGKVDVTLANDGNGAELKIKDSGPGIPMEYRDRIFERFYRMPENDVPGSGLGLAIVKQIIQRHRASISVTDGGNSPGSTFTIKFN